MIENWPHHSYSQYPNMMGIQVFKSVAGKVQISLLSSPAWIKAVFVACNEINIAKKYIKLHDTGCVCVCVCACVRARTHVWETESKRETWAFRGTSWTGTQWNSKFIFCSLQYSKHQRRIEWKVIGHHTLCRSQEHHWSQALKHCPPHGADRKAQEVKRSLLHLLLQVQSLLNFHYFNQASLQRLSLSLSPGVLPCIGAADKCSGKCVHL